MQSTSLNLSEWRAGISLAAVYILRMLGLFMVIPVIAIAAVDYPDYSPFLVGLAIGGYGLTQALLQIPMGLLSDKWGRKPVIYMGLCFFAAGSLIAGLADSMWLMTIGRILQGAGAIAGAVMALATDVTRESQRTKIMALIGVSIGMSFYLALLLGPLIADNLGMQGIFLITAGLAFLCLPLVRFGVPKSKQIQPTGDSLPKLHQLQILFKERHLWRLNISVLVVHMLITCFFVQVPVQLISTGVPLGNHWHIYSLVLAASVILLFAMIKILDRQAITISFRLSLALMMAGFVLLIMSSDTWTGIALAGILFFTGFNFLEAKMPSMVSSISPAGQKGSAMGIYASHQFFGAFLGGLASGLLNSFFSPVYTFIMCLLIIFLLNFVVKGLSSTQRIKRVTLSLSDHHIKSGLLADLQTELMRYDGVLEAIVDPIDAAVYLKVDAKTFDAKQAAALVNT